MTTRTRTPDETVVRESTSGSDGGTGQDGAEALPGLSAVLDEVRASLRADTTTLLVVDSSRTSLEPAATVGLDRTLRRARRVPLGQGFAGRVAQTRQPVALTQVDSSTVVNPVLLAHGVQSLLGVPVMDGSELVGVLHVGWRSPHAAGDEETLRLLLSLGASARQVTSRWDGTALIAAAHEGHAGVVRQLIRAGAPLDHVNNLHWTAVIESIVLGDGGPRHQATLKALVEAGANLRLADRQGMTPLQLARSRGYAEMVKLLEAAGAR